MDTYAPARHVLVLLGVEGSVFVEVVRVGDPALDQQRDALKLNEVLEYLVPGAASLLGQRVGVDRVVGSGSLQDLRQEFCWNAAGVKPDQPIAVAHSPRFRRVGFLQLRQRIRSFTASAEGMRSAWRTASS